jgi:hypothetical protein
MTRFKNTPQLIAVMMTTILLLSILQSPVSAQTDTLDPIVVLYDASHTPQFAADDADIGFKLMLDMVNSSTKYIVRVNEDPINKTILSDVDILIMAEPDRSAEFEPEEIDAIAEMLANGSSLLAMGDPTIAPNSTYWGDQVFQDIGDNIALNRMFDALNMTGVRFSINSTDEDRFWGDTLFDYEKSINTTIPWVIQLDATTWDATHPIFKDINTLLTMTATLKPIDLPSAVGRSYDSSFAQWRRGPNSWANTHVPNITLEEYAENPLLYSAINTSRPAWLSAFDYNGSRVIVMGSAIMFTGRSIDLPASDTRSELQWFYQADNSRLFMNMLDWLSDRFVTAPDAILPVLIISTGFLALGVVFYIFKKLR